MSVMGVNYGLLSQQWNASEMSLWSGKLSTARIDF